MRRVAVNHILQPSVIIDLLFPLFITKHSGRPTLISILIDIKNLVEPVIASNPSWSGHVTPSTLQLFQDDSSWSLILKKENNKMFEKDNIPSYSSSNPSLLDSFQSSLSFSSSEDGMYRSRFTKNLPL